MKNRETEKGKILENTKDQTIDDLKSIVEAINQYKEQFNKVVELEKELHEEVEKMALQTYKALKCEVYARVDMIVTEKGIPYILEVNTLPGMTKNSLIPKSAAALNISFSKLIDMIIEDSMKIIR